MNSHVVNDAVTMATFWVVLYMYNQRQTTHRTTPIDGKNTLLHRDFVEIGQGAEGTVYVNLRDNTTCKICNSSSTESKNVREYKHILLSSPYLIKPYQVREHALKQKSTITMQHGGISLHKALTCKHSIAISSKKCNTIALHICRGIRYLHHHRLMHGDVKLRNVVVDDKGHARLCDYGTLHSMTPNNCIHRRHVPQVFYYTSHTHAEGVHDQLSTFAVDWFACAVSLYVMYVHVQRANQTPLTKEDYPFIVHAEHNICNNRIVLPIKILNERLLKSYCPMQMTLWIVYALHEKTNTLPPNVSVE